MKPYLSIGVVLAVAIASGAGGFWIGFREAWNLGLMADAAPTGVVALGQIRQLESGRTDDLKFKFEADVDSGLMWWHEISRSPLQPVLNELSGYDVFPAYETYIRRLAVYRKSHPSPVLALELNHSDPALAAALAQGRDDTRKAVEEVVSKYAP